MTATTDTLATASQIEKYQGLTDFVLNQLSEQSEYDKRELDMQADLQSDLGVDSIIIASVAGSVTTALKLNVSVNIQGVDTIAQFISLLEGVIEKHQPDVSVFQTATADNDTANTSSVASGDEKLTALDHLIIQTFALHSGYSQSDLDLTADLESDLGIDSVTHITVMSDLQRELGLIDTQIPDDLNTIEKVKAFFTAQYQAGFIAADKLKGQSTTDTKTNAIKEEGAEVIQLHADDTAADNVSGKNNVADATVASTETMTEEELKYRTMQDFVSIENKDLFFKTREFAKFYQAKRDKELLWYGMPLSSQCRNRAMIFDDITGETREFLMFASNNYLGLANHPDVIDAIQQAAGQYGATNTGCRLIGGSNVLHLELERKLAELKGRESCIVFPSGYSANLGGISALTGKKDLVFTDAINHMSIQDGCKLSGAQRKIYAHSMDSLEKTLAKYADHPGGKLIVTDGVFSMHGDIVDLPRLNRLAKQYGAKVLVDDAHSTGVLGKTGSGTTEHFNMKGEVDLELGTMSKALAGLGGFICGDEDVIDYMRFYANSYVFAATIPAPVAAGCIASIDVMKKEPHRLELLWQNINHLRAKLLAAGFNLENSYSAIIPVVVGDDQKTLELGRAVRKRGMYCQTVVYPGVAVGDARLRISVSSEHTMEDLELAAQIVIDAAHEVGISTAYSA